MKVCQECLNMYFDGVPLTNQFLCRAYLCQAQLLSPKSANDAVSWVQVDRAFLNELILHLKDIILRKVRVCGVGVEIEKLQ